MTEAVSNKNAECNLEELLNRLPFGESITLTGPEGCPVAILVSLKSGKAERKPVSDWGCSNGGIVPNGAPRLESRKECCRGSLGDAKVRITIDNSVFVASARSDEPNYLF
jgi:hypothetical protein